MENTLRQGEIIKEQGKGGKRKKGHKRVLATIKSGRERVR